MWTRPTKTTLIGASAEGLDHFGLSEEYIVNAGWEITPRHGIYRRYVWNDDSQTPCAYTFHATERIDSFVVDDTQPGMAAQLLARLLVTLP